VDCLEVLEPPSAVSVDRHLTFHDAIVHETWNERVNTMQRRRQIDYASPSMRRRLLKVVLCAATILATLATDLAPHHHDDWIDGLGSSFNGQDIHDADCRAPGTRTHLHADRVRHVDTCVACLRQHIQAIGNAALVRVSDAIVSRLTSHVAIAHICAVNLSKSSRGPPPSRG